MRQQGRRAGFLGCWNDVPFTGTGQPAHLRARLGRGVLLMPKEHKSVTVHVFAAPSAFCGSGMTWEAATAFLGKRLQQRFGEAVAVEHIEMFTARSFEFPDVLQALERGGALPLVRVGGQIVSQGERLSENRIAGAISELLELDRRQS